MTYPEAEEKLRSLENKISNNYPSEFKELLHALDNYSELVYNRTYYTNPPRRLRWQIELGQKAWIRVKDR
jgi:hypothetical protein